MAKKSSIRGQGHVHTSRNERAFNRVERVYGSRRIYPLEEEAVLESSRRVSLSNKAILTISLALSNVPDPKRPSTTKISALTKTYQTFPFHSTSPHDSHASHASIQSALLPSFKLRDNRPPASPAPPITASNPPSPISGLETRPRFASPNQGFRTALQGLSAPALVNKNKSWRRYRLQACHVLHFAGWCSGWLSTTVERGAGTERVGRMGLFTRPSVIGNNGRGWERETCDMTCRLRLEDGCHSARGAGATCITVAPPSACRQPTYSMFESKGGESSAP
jgi:hypothetical protein